MQTRVKTSKESHGRDFHADAHSSSHTHKPDKTNTNTIPTNDGFSGIGNQNLQSLLRSGTIQAKLAISPPSDPMEREADNVANSIIQRKEACSCGGTCSKCQQQKELIQRKASRAQRDTQMSASPGVLSRLGDGRSLDPTTTRFFNKELNHDFSKTRIHTDSNAADSAASINARAFTHGNDVVFGKGQFSPNTTDGTKLLAHELTHVVQQNGGAGVGLKRTPPPFSECSTDRATSKAVQEGILGQVSSTAIGIARQMLEPSQEAESSDDELLMSEQSSRSFEIQNMSDESLLREFKIVSRALQKQESYEGREQAERYRVDLWAEIMDRPGLEVSSKIAQKPRSLEGSISPRKQSFKAIREEIKLINKWKNSPALSTEEKVHLELQLETFKNELRRKRKAQRRSKARVERKVQKLSDAEVEKEILQKLNEPGTYEIKLLLKQRHERRTRPVVAPKSVADAILMLEESYREIQQYKVPNNKRALKLVQSVRSYFRLLTRPSNIQEKFTEKGLVRYEFKVFPGMAYEAVGKWEFMIKLGSTIGGHWRVIMTTVKAAQEGLEVLAGDRSLRGTSLLKTQSAINDGSKITIAITVGVPVLIGLSPLIATEVGILSFAIRRAGTTLITWTAQGGTTLIIWAGTEKALAAELIAFGFVTAEGIDEAGGAGNYIEGLTTWKGLIGLASDLLGIYFSRFFSGGGRSNSGQNVDSTPKRAPKRVGRKLAEELGKGVQNVTDPFAVGAGGVAKNPPARVQSVDPGQQGSSHTRPDLPSSVSKKVASEKQQQGARDSIAASSALEASKETTSPKALPAKAAGEKSPVAKNAAPEKTAAQRTGESELELDLGEWQERITSFNEFDPEIDVLVPSDLKVANTQKQRDAVSRRKSVRPEFGEASDEKAGTEHRKGSHFHELNEAEVGPTRLRVDFDSKAGRPRSVTYQMNREALSNETQVDRRFKPDPSVEGAQSRVSAYTNSGYEKGHLAQREVFKGSIDAEVAVDQMTNIVPMTEALNRGAGSPWRAAEQRTVEYVKPVGQGGGGHEAVKVKVEPIYDANPPRLSDGTPVPKEIHRTVTTLDGQVLEDATYLNQ